MASSRDRPGLRVRLTALAALLVALVLAAGWAVLLLAVRHSVYGSLDSSALQQAKDVAALVQSGQLPDPIPIGAGTAGVQVVDGQDAVVAVSAGTDRLEPLLDPGDLRTARRGGVVVIAGSRLGVPDAIRLVASAVPGDPQGRTVLVAVSQAEAQGTLHTLVLAGVVAVPLLVAGFALVCWALVGRSLLPVARLRAGAQEIAAAGRPDGRRLPVPAPQDEIRRLAETLNGMLDRLEASSSAQRAFVADAAHELRSPLTAIRTQLEVARHHPESADWIETADGVVADTERLARLVDDLLVLARIGDGHPSRGPDAGPGADVAALAAQVAARPGWPVPVRQDPGDDGDPGDDDPGDGHDDHDDTERAGKRADHGPASTVAASSDDVVRVLTNLVDNATRHASSEVRLVVRPAGGDGSVQVLVTDDGPGIPVQERERVFERFARLDVARSRDRGGSGLGLAIVRSLVEASGGTVRIEDGSLGRGTTVLVTWPAAVTSVTNPRSWERTAPSETMNSR